MKNNQIGVIFQAFYGNRTYTQIDENDIDRMLQGILDDRFPLDCEIDRSIVKIPDSQCVIVYNKHQEAQTLVENKRWLELDGYVAKPLAFIPEENINIYSRCFVCRLDESGKFKSLEAEDDDVIFQYLAR